jgi:outer membrane protein OmpA-like peptidoglycan-associated protein
MTNKTFTIAVFSFLLFSFSLSAQTGSIAQSDSIVQDSKLRGWSIGFRGTWLYDLESTIYDGSVAEDPRGLNGDNTSVDFGMEFYLEKQFTPFMGMQANYRVGGLTGATSTEYYSTDFSEFRLGMSLIWSNLDPNHVNSKWNFYNGVGAMFGSFDAERFLEADQSSNGQISDSYNGFYLSGGIMYELAPSWRVELDMAYNIVRNDGFDGFDYATGWDPYINAGIGLAYTFGNSAKPAMYAGNYYESPYYDLAKTKARVNQLEGRVGNLEASAVRGMDALDQIKQESEKRDEALANADKTLAQKMLDLERGPDKTLTAPKAVVFFAFDSSELTEAGKEELLKNLAGLKEPIIISAYTDNVGTADYNDQLKARRAEAVKTFLIEELKMDPMMVGITDGNEMDLSDQFLARRVEVR